MSSHKSLPLSVLSHKKYVGIFATAVERKSFPTISPSTLISWPYQYHCEWQQNGAILRGVMCSVMFRVCRWHGIFTVSQKTLTEDNCLLWRPNYQVNKTLLCSACRGIANWHKTTAQCWNNVLRRCSNIEPMSRGSLHITTEILHHKVNKVSQVPCQCSDWKLLILWWNCQFFCLSNINCSRFM